MSRETEPPENVSPGPRRTEAELPPELKSLEAALASLAPSPAGLDRDRVLFLAGQRSAARRPVVRLTAAWAMAMTAAAALLLVVVVRRGEPQVVERIVHVPVEPAAEAAPAEPTAEGTEVAASPAAVARPAEDPYAAAFRARSPYFRQLDRLLAEGADLGAGLPDEMPGPVGRSAGGSGPATYRELWEEMLDGQASGRLWLGPQTATGPIHEGARS